MLVCVVQQAAWLKERSMSCVGTESTFLLGRPELHRNNTMLLDSNQHLVRPDYQLDAPQVAEGSAVMLGGSEISMSFPIIAVLQTELQAPTHFRVPLHSTKDTVVFKIRYGGPNTHDSLYNHAYLCFPLVKKTQHDNAAAGALQWPEILTVVEPLLKCHRNVLSIDNMHQKSYELLLPNFLAIFLPDHNTFAKHSESLSTDIRKHCLPIKDWNSAPDTISANEKYLLIMMMGTDNALQALQHHMLQQQRKSECGKDDCKVFYDDMGDLAVSAYAVSFTLRSSLMGIYDMCYDVFLNLLAVATKRSGWQNSVIEQDCAKIKLVQAKLIEESDDMQHSDYDVCVLGQRVCSYSSRIARVCVLCCDKGYVLIPLGSRVCVCSCSACLTFFFAHTDAQRLGDIAQDASRRKKRARQRDCVRRCPHHILRGHTFYLRTGQVEGRHFAGDHSHRYDTTRTAKTLGLHPPRTVRAEQREFAAQHY